MIPPQLGNLSRLQYLDFSNNDGLMASADISWLSHLKSLRHLDMSQVSLQDSKEWVQSLNKLHSLEVLILDNNSLTYIPQSLPFVNFTSLRILQLSNQNFSTRIPDWIFELHGLNILNLEFCYFEGAFPAALGNLTYLSKLDLGCSALQGKYPPLNKLTKLTYLDLSCVLDGKPFNISELFKKISPESRRSLEVLILFDTHLSGSLNGLSSEMPNLKHLDFSANLLSGPIPSDFWNLTNLVKLDLSGNGLTGSLTNVRLNRLSKLEELILGGNQLEGKITSLPYNISIVDLSSNRLEQFPDLSKAPRLKELNLHSNSLTGEFPSSLQTFRRLEYLDLGENKFYGEIPHWIGENMSNLMYLRMHSNLFSGKIPSKLALLTKLQVLDLADNNLSGPIPENLDSFAGMRLQYESWNEEYSTSIDLSNNHLTGEIPRNIIALRELVNLNLSKNQLVGDIPAEIGRIKYLECLDLHSNNLSGTIPTSISDLNSLRVLDLSYNNLSGSIPTWHQLHKLDAPPVYIGNPYLCGPPLRNGCRTNGPTPGSNDSFMQARHRKWWFYIFTEVGFVIGCFVVFSILTYVLVAILFKRYKKK
ncbi:Receptor-like protein 12 [Rhynchospora pubera]|uniref:Receptor-like protein 12 n=1 Tax=Rhynchospora pubera TaxID=906938 RepID=A0AAV8D3K6_9POAL|nr:Receptor-like protein 12 [Rhynchospora pubera]